MKTIGALVDYIDKNHKKSTPYLIVSTVLILLLALISLPSYDEYCKEPQAVCKEHINVRP